MVGLTEAAEVAEAADSRGKLSRDAADFPKLHNQDPRNIMSLLSLSIEDTGEFNVDLSLSPLISPEKIGDPFRVVENEVTLSKFLPRPVLIYSRQVMYLVPPQSV